MTHIHSPNSPFLMHCPFYLPTYFHPAHQLRAFQIVPKNYTIIYDASCCRFSKIVYRWPMQNWQNGVPTLVLASSPVRWLAPSFTFFDRPARNVRSFYQKNAISKGSRILSQLLPFFFFGNTRLDSPSYEDDESFEKHFRVGYWP